MGNSRADGAPWSIQFRMTFTSSGVSLAPTGGIAPEVILFTKRLPAESPAVIAAPDFPPLSKVLLLRKGATGAPLPGRDFRARLA